MATETALRKRENLDAAQPDAHAIESVLVQGDLSKLTPEQRVSYVGRVCESLGLNYLTRPFQFLTLQNRTVMYATRDCGDQLRKLHGVSITDVETERQEDVFIVRVKARDRSGRTDAATGAVSLSGLKGVDLANAMMKAETKAKRRVTLSICGLGMLDETEVADVGDPASPPTIQQPVRIANGNGGGTKEAEVITPEQRKQLFRVCAEAGWATDQVKEILLSEFGIKSSAEIPTQQFAAILKFFERGYIAHDEDIPF